jgi:hypothetical protein
MAQLEYAGIKISGGKILMIVPLVSAIGGALWAGFEFYSDYMDMRQKIESYEAPDLSEIHERLTQIETAVDRDVKAIKDGHLDIEESLRDFKLDIADDLDSVYSSVDAQDDRNRKNVETVRGVINSFEVRMDAKIGRLEKSIDSLRSDVDEKIERALNNPLSD